MTIKELKKALSRFPNDMDDTEILISYVPSETKVEEFDLWAFTAYSELKEDTVLVLGTHQSVLLRSKQGTLKFVDGTVPKITDPGATGE
jgi:hypothetical protein